MDKYIIHLIDASTKQTVKQYDSLIVPSIGDVIVINDKLACKVDHRVLPEIGELNDTAYIILMVTITT